MSIILFGDLHLNNWRQFSTILPNGLNSRLVDQMRVVGKIGNLLTKDDVVIFGGDLIDSYGETLPKIIFNAAFHTLKLWASRCKHIYAMVGNHDIYRLVNILTSFDEIDNVTVINRTTELEIEGRIVDMIPWEGKLPESKGDVFVGHIMPVGAHLGSLWTKRADEGVPIKWFDGYDIAISFHVHEPQTLPVPGSTTSVQCPGSIMQLNLASSSAPRYIWKLDRGLKKIEIESPKIYTLVINTQKEADDFVSGGRIPGYHKLVVTDHTIRLPQMDHTVVIEYESSPMSGEIEESNVIDLREVVNSFIDSSEAKVDKVLAKELIGKLW